MLSPERIHVSRQKVASSRVVLLAAFAVVAAGPSSLRAGELRLPKPGDDVVPGRFLVLLKADASDLRRAGFAVAAGARDATATAVADLTGAAPTPVGTSLGVLSVDLSAPAGEGIAAAPGDGLSDEAVAKLEAIAALPNVEVVEPVYRRHVSAYTPTDPRVGELYYFQRIKAIDAFTNTPTGNPPVLVAVLDDGLHLAHPDLKKQLWTNSKETAGNGMDDDGNGYVDDINGYDFANGDAVPQAEYAPNAETPSWESHGTHVTGTILATWNNGQGIAGVCSHAQVMVLKIIGNGAGGGTSESTVAAINYAVNNGAKLLNCSFGGEGFSDAEDRAVQYARSKGALLICAAGNNSKDEDVTPSYPGSFPYDNIISVAATDQNDALAGFSHYGAKNVDLAAPGVAILSTYISGPANNLQVGYQTEDGTSMSTPIVTGVLATALDRNPSLTAAQLRSNLFATVDKLASLSGKTVTGGRVNMAAFLGAVGKPGLAATSAAYSQNAYAWAYYGYVYAAYAYAGLPGSTNAYYAYGCSYYGYSYAYTAHAYGATVARDTTYVNNYRYNQALWSYYAYLYGYATYGEAPATLTYYSALANYYAFAYGYADLQLFK